MKNQFKKIIIAASFIMTLASCSTTSRTMREPIAKVDLVKSDFTLSDQVSADAKTVKVLGVDWERLFKQKSASVTQNASPGITLYSVPIIGGALGDRTLNYALFNLMESNPGYDVVFYPQYETKVMKPVLGLGFLCKITKVKTTARLGKLNK